MIVEEIVHFDSEGFRLEGVLSYKEDLVSTTEPPLRRTSSPGTLRSSEYGVGNSQFRNPQSASLWQAHPTALICPPHPNLGGDMDNNVVKALAQELAGGGYNTLRFNYRGVKGSEGPFQTVAERFRYWETTFGEGNLEGAMEDTRAALRFLKSQRVFIVGYSFGAVIGMRVGAGDDRVVALAGIATPCAVYNLSVLFQCKKPKLFICSDSDFATSVEDTRRAFEGVSEPKRLVVKTSMGHFYVGNEQEIAREVLSFFNGLSAGSA
jgi:alpha/beta superfamily hydrolase